ncbi:MULTISPECIES: DNA replication/repair protein RecF [Clostridium]|jgi:DNA replication and repair protein RecF|uniref:DNA replication/repair protein RecF n=1 Tax=Clostridium TaxID=1485 RepID=UPI0002892596|nr:MULTISPECIES: DNA replication/repair protein RecF [Clostridium]MDF2503221.1 recF protein [Clostridium sp.]
MHIGSLILNNFRNYEKLNIQLDKNINIFTGDNAQGKTNILESIYYCSVGKSYRTNKDKELIQWKKESAYINLYICKERLNKKIEIKIFKEGKKGINVNSIKLRKISELFGIFNAVIFSPEDLKIVKEGPVYRRKFLDIELSKLNSRYYFELVQYNKVLNERNALLRSRNDKAFDILDIYDQQLSRYGSKIIKYRLDYIKKLNEFGNVIHKDITSGKENIEFRYIMSAKNTDTLEQDLLKCYELNRDKDIYRRNTSIGPHKDDFSIEINNIDTRSYGSQGQQRTAILTIKFSTLSILKEYTKEAPVLLLDDVLSELDTSRQKYILNSINGIQTIITCTGINDIDNYINGNFKVFKVEYGKVSEVSKL